MVTRTSLSTVRMDVDPVDNSEWHYVEHNGDRYILVATNVTENDIEEVLKRDPALGIMFLLGAIPAVDTAIFRGDENWQIIGECDDSCADGVCTKRLASRRDVGSIEVAYQMLVDYLNA